MAEYRFIAFPTGVKPTAEEVARLEARRDALANHLAYGRVKNADRLAIGCDAAPFDELRGVDPAFEELLTQWLVRGAEITESVPFTKDAKAWKRLRAAEEPSLTPEPHGKTEPAGASTASVRPSAAESAGRGRLATVDVAERARRYERLGKWLPYAFVLGGWVLAIGVGAYVGGRLLDSPAERRSGTIERVAGDALGESLDRQLAVDETPP